MSFQQGALPNPPGQGPLPTPPASAPPPPPTSAPPGHLRNPSFGSTPTVVSTPPPADDDVPASPINSSISSFSSGSTTSSGAGIVPAGGVALPKPKGKVMVLNAIQRELIRELEEIFGAPWGMEAVVKGLKTNKEDAIQWIIKKQETAAKKKADAASSSGSGSNTPLASPSGTNTPPTMPERPAIPARTPSISTPAPPTTAPLLSPSTSTPSPTTTGARSMFSTFSASVFGKKEADDTKSATVAAAEKSSASTPLVSSSADLTDPVEIGKRAAAMQAVSDYLTPAIKVVGIGSGSTIHYAIDHIISLCRSRKQFLQCVPTSFQSKLLILRGAPELSLAALDSVTSVDFAIDGADEVDDDLNLIKGGGGCALQEKCVASAAKQFVVICDSRKDSKKLGEQWKLGIPIEVLPMAHQLVTFRLLALGASAATLRISQSGKAGPVVTDNGNFIIDADFGTLTGKWTPEKLNTELSLIPGILETGLFINMCQRAYFGGVDGKVKTRDAKGKSKSWLG